MVKENLQAVRRYLAPLRCTSLIIADQVASTQSMDRGDVAAISRQKHAKLRWSSKRQLGASALNARGTLAMR